MHYDEVVIYVHCWSTVAMVTITHATMLTQLRQNVMNMMSWWEIVYADWHEEGGDDRIQWMIQRGFRSPVATGDILKECFIEKTDSNAQFD